MNIDFLILRIDTSLNSVLQIFCISSGNIGEFHNYWYATGIYFLIKDFYDLENAKQIYTCTQTS